MRSSDRRDAKSDSFAVESIHGIRAFSGAIPAVLLVYLGQLPTSCPSTSSRLGTGSAARPETHHGVLAISAGANVKVVQRLQGHAAAAMTIDRYGHLLNDDLNGVADALGKAIESAAVSLRYPECSGKAESA